MNDINSPTTDGPATTEADAGNALVLEGVTRSYEQGETSLEVLRGIDFELRPGEIVGLIGPSGAGKSTLLHIAGLLEKPSAGSVRIGGMEAAQLDDAGRTALRRRRIGFVYQFHHLLPEFTARENVMLPQLIAGLSEDEARKRADELLGFLGLADRVLHRPGELSGGEQQRVAIARAVANVPDLLLADEPTGNLDPHTAEHVFDILLKLVHGTGLGALIATHNIEFAERMDRRITLRDGHLVEL
ncbi:ABC transporter ATP-binding protein [Lutibaculum baratangense]|uniref:Lipoprotein releasing system ATP-binding protein LolD n=1 Tax=Lutibaculum baratangense AMV1 TaxID=631454 RepID=V4QZF0_9HYPH|nr:ABC transporter ATP-binding protein [Lutibaculum baratangense]ESR25132.1 Lipoprotein releasing system ATP-binding protein LolD [Lutibaculum baratangense AMV1]